MRREKRITGRRTSDSNKRSVNIGLQAGVRNDMSLIWSSHIQMFADFSESPSHSENMLFGFIDLLN